MFCIGITINSGQSSNFILWQSDIFFLNLKSERESYEQVLSILGT